MAFFLALVLGIRWIIFLKSMTVTFTLGLTMAVMAVTVTVAMADLSEQK